MPGKEIQKAGNAHMCPVVVQKEKAYGKFTHNACGRQGRRSGAGS